MNITTAIASYRPRLAMMLMALAMFTYTTSNSLIKFCDQSYPPTQVLCFRYVFALIPCIFLGGGWRIFYGRQVGLKIYAIRGFASAIVLSCFFTSIYILPFADAIVLMFLAPLFMVLLSPLLLKEGVTRRQSAAVLVGFIGVVIIANPAQFNHWIRFVPGIISACLEAALLLNARELTRYEDSAKIVFYSTIFGALISLALLPFFWKTPTLKDLFLLIFLGLGGGVGHYLQTLASRFATAGVISPIVYTAMIWSTLYSHFIFRESLTVSLWIGSGLIIMSGLWVAVNGNRNPIKV